MEGRGSPPPITLPWPTNMMRVPHTIRPSILVLRPGPRLPGHPRDHASCTHAPTSLNKNGLSRCQSHANSFDPVLTPLKSPKGSGSTDSTEAVICHGPIRTWLSSTLSGPRDNVSCCPASPWALNLSTQGSLVSDESAQGQGPGLRGNVGLGLSLSLCCIFPVSSSPPCPLLSCFILRPLYPIFNICVLHESVTHLLPLQVSNLPPC